MNVDRRNPYLVLGVQYGTGREDATTAFAHRSRRARRDEAFPYTIDDLTWALNQIEAHIQNPTADIDTYRVPADPTALEVPAGAGFLRPSPIRMPRQTAPLGDEDLATIRAAAHDEALDEYVLSSSAILVREYDLFTPTPMPNLSVTVRRKRRWPRALAASVIVAGALGAGAVVAIRQVDRRDDRAAVEPSTTSTSEPEQPVRIGPLVISPADDYDSTEWSEVDLTGIESGACFNLTSADGLLALAEPRQCEEPHRFELVSIGSIPPEVVDYAEVDSAADNLCIWNYTVYVGTNPAESALTYWYSYPNADRWPLDRVTHCWASSPGQELIEGSAFQSKV